MKEATTVAVIVVIVLAAAFAASYYSYLAFGINHASYSYWVGPANAGFGVSGGIIKLKPNETLVTLTVNNTGSSRVFYVTFVNTTVSASNGQPAFAGTNYFKVTFPFNNGNPIPAGQTFTQTFVLNYTMKRGEILTNIITVNGSSAWSATGQEIT